MQEILKTKAQLPKPFRIAVYFKEPPQSRKKQTWRWTKQDKNMIDRMEASMKEQRSVSSVFPLLPSLVQDNSLRAIRSAAARQGAAAVLVISGVSEVDSYANNAAFKKRDRDIMKEAKDKAMAKLEKNLIRMVKGTLNKN